jgi:NDP-sugar pyrophosphorylase family protein
MRAMILAAGFGTRLGALSDERPKPMLPVADYPLLRFNLALLAAHGFDEVAINLHHRGELIRAELGERAEGLRIVYSEEDTILGTGGGLRRMRDWLTDGGQPFVVLNGKLVTDVNLTALVGRHRESGAVATMVVREVPDAERWGAIDVGPTAGGAGRVVRMLEKGEHPDVRHRAMFTGVHVLEPRLVARLPDGESCIIRQGYLPALRDGEPIGAVLYDRYFQEHSTPARYLDGNLAVLRGEARLLRAPGPLTGAHPTAEIAPGARLAGVHRIGERARIGEGALIEDSVVGRGASVAPGAQLRRVVVWPGARAEGSIESAIVTPKGVFPIAQS